MAWAESGTGRPLRKHVGYEDHHPHPVPRPDKARAGQAGPHRAASQNWVNRTRCGQQRVAAHEGHSRLCPGGIAESSGLLGSPETCVQ